MVVFVQQDASRCQWNSFRGSAVIFLLGSIGLVTPLSVVGAATIDKSSYYTPPSQIGCLKDVVADFGAHRASGSRQNERFQRAVDSVAECEGGGILTVPPGSYYLKGIELKSNVHLRIDQRAIFHPSNRFRDEGSAIFEIGLDVPETIRNVSIVGKGSGFTFDLRTGGDREAAIQVGDARNFKISNFTVKDRQTVLSSVNFRISVGPRDEINWAHDGIVEKAHQIGADIGYGLIQVHALKHVLFDDISSQGGVALRLEPDTPRMRLFRQGGVFDLRARNVGCSDGMAAVMLQPHVTKNGSVTIDGVHSDSCGFTVRTEPGDVEVLGDVGESRAELIARVEERLDGRCIKSVFERAIGTFLAVIESDCAEDASQKLGVQAGTFGRVTISDVVSQYGEKSQFKKNQYEFLSCPEQGRACRPQRGRNLFQGGSVAAVYDQAQRPGTGGYRITTRDVHAVGYPVQNRAIVTPRSETNICVEFSEVPICGE